MPYGLADIDCTRHRFELACSLVTRRLTETAKDIGSRKEYATEQTPQRASSSTDMLADKRDLQSPARAHLYGLMPSTSRCPTVTLLVRASAS